MNTAAQRVEHLAQIGFLSETEADEFLEHISAEIRAVDDCGVAVHPGELPEAVVQAEEEAEEEPGEAQRRKSFFAYKSDDADEETTEIKRDQQKRMRMVKSFHSLTDLIEDDA